MSARGTALFGVFKHLSKIIAQSRACLYGTTVPLHFFAALTHDESEDGFLGRMLIFMGAEEPEEQATTLRDVPPELVESLVALANRPINVEPRGNIDEKLIPRPRIYPLDAGAQEQFAALNTWVMTHRALHRSQRIAAIWGRSWEMAAKVALILAASRRDGPAVILDAEARYAIALVRWCAECMAASIALYVAENETESTNKRVERLIRESGADGTTLAALHNRTRFLKKRERTEVIDDLVESGLIFRQSAPAQGQGDRPVTRLIHATFSGEVE